MAAEETAGVVMAEAAVETPASHAILILRISRMTFYLCLFPTAQKADVMMRRHTRKVSFSTRTAASWAREKLKQEIRRKATSWKQLPRTTPIRSCLLHHTTR